MAKYKSNAERRKIRNRHQLRKKAAGRARLCVCRSNQHISAQIIDDTLGQVIASASTMQSWFKGKVGSNVDAAAAVGKKVAEEGKKKKVKTVVFDRGEHIFHGRVKALADAAREAGLEF